MSISMTDPTLADLERAHPLLLGGLTRARYAVTPPDRPLKAQIVADMERKIAPRLHHDYATITRRLGV
ncbi:hypothetical protein [Niveispirillum sp. KHB5.9]|uniref:hypothetical protein n=1 Tax=Niveispirillum sp. KHB5.9 TaxID=3400269 RepID=UPI003A85002B